MTDASTEDHEDRRKLAHDVAIIGRDLPESVPGLLDDVLATWCVGGKSLSALVVSSDPV